MSQIGRTTPGAGWLLGGFAAATVAFVVNLFTVPAAVHWGVWSLLVAGVVGGSMMSRSAR